jgi:peptidoglycan/LPS O-acetylase OafA/YrhL
LHRGLTWRVPLAWGVGFAGLVALVRFGGNGTLDYTLDFGTVRCMLDFVIGIGCYQLYRAPRWQPILRRDGVFSLAVVLTVALLHFDSRDVLMIPSFSLLIVTAASNQGAPKRLLGWRPLRHLGEVSYSVYLMQVIPLCVWKVWVDLDWKPRHPGVEPGMALTLFWLAAILGALVGLATLTHRYVELAGQRALESVGAKKRDGGEPGDEAEKKAVPSVTEASSAE